jgi:hypothetical protein
MLPIPPLARLGIRTKSRTIATIDKPAVTSGLVLYGVYNFCKTIAALGKIVIVARLVIRTGELETEE